MVVAISAAARRITSLHVCCAVLVAVIAARPVLATAFVAPGMRRAPRCVIAAFVPPHVAERLLPRRGAVPAAGAAGLLLPACECASVPVARRMIGRGVPDAAALTFLLAAPAINPVVLVATAVAFPGEPLMVLARGTASLVTAWALGWLWQRWGRPEWIAARVRTPPDRDGMARWAVFAETARHDLVSAGGFLVVGGLAAAVLAVVVPASWTTVLGRDLVLAIAVLTVLAVVLALCSEADAFVAASLSAVPLTARLVFLVVGPAVDVKLIALQAGTFGRSFALRFAPATLAVAVLCATATGLLLLGVR